MNHPAVGIGRVLSHIRTQQQNSQNHTESNADQYTDGFVGFKKWDHHSAFFHFFFHLIRINAVRLVRKTVSVMANQVYGMGRSTVLIP